MEFLEASSRVAGAYRRWVLLAALVSWVSMTAAAPAFAARPAGGLTISPAPNTPDASPQTQISILGVPRGQIESVRVTGQASGVHGGRLRPYSGKRGASFVPDQPLTQGEPVAVVVRVSGRAPIRFSFTVAHLAPTPPTLNLTATQPDKLDHFVTEPDLTPPHITINEPAPRGLDGGDVMLTPLPSPIVHPDSNNTVTINPVRPGRPMS